MSSVTRGASPLGAVGMVRASPRRVVSVEPFFMEFLAGAEEVLTTQGLSVLLAVVPGLAAELETYERWARSRMVDAVMVMNVLDEDPRPALLADLGLCAVMVGSWDSEPVLPSVRAGDASAMRSAAEHLVSLGHRHLAHVTGPAAYRHTQARVAALDEVATLHGVRVDRVEGDYSDGSGETAARALLTQDQRPTAMIFDNDVMGVAALHAAHGLGIRVPEDLSLLAWDDSPLCRLTHPPLTTMSLDVHTMGRLVGTAVLDTIAGRAPRDTAVVGAGLQVRGSTGPAPTR